MACEIVEKTWVGIRTTHFPNSDMKLKNTKRVNASNIEIECCGTSSARSIFHEFPMCVSSISSEICLQEFTTQESFQHPLLHTKMSFYNSCQLPISELVVGLGQILQD